MTEEQGRESLVRRLAFAGDSRYLFDSIASRGPGPALAQALGGRPWQRVPDRLATRLFDLGEAVRAGGGVPHAGEARRAALSAGFRVPQHPRYLGWWHDPARRAAVGMHVGVDLIRREGKLWVLEINLDAALRPDRRALYEERFDPVVEGLVEAAADGGYRRLVPYARRWRKEAAAELVAAGRERGVEVRPTSVGWEQPGARHALAGLPVPLERDTLYVAFSPRHTPLDTFVHDKYGLSTWLAGALEREVGAGGRIACAPTWPELTVPPPDPEGWPNLVVKLAAYDMGQGVVIAKVADEAEARAALGVPAGGGVPTVFRRGPVRRWLDRRGGRDQILWQRYLPPELDPERRLIKLRMHMLLTPVGSRFLSIHAVIGRRAVPERFPPGVQPNDGSLILSFSQGARYRRVGDEIEGEAREAAAELARAFATGVPAAFETGPEIRQVLA